METNSGNLSEDFEKSQKVKYTSTIDVIDFEKGSYQDILEPPTETVKGLNNRHITLLSLGGAIGMYNLFAKKSKNKIKISVSYTDFLIQGRVYSLGVEVHFLSLVPLHY